MGLWGRIGAALLAGVLLVRAEPEPKPVTEPELVVTLIDGSRLRGTSPLQQFRVRSATLGSLTVSLQHLVRAELTTETIQLWLHNGDQFRAGLVETVLPLQTLVGPLNISLEKVKAIDVRPRGVILLEWEPAEFPVDSDWPGPKGAPSAVAAEELITHGRPLRTKEVLQGPLQLDCEITLDQLRTTDGALWLFCVPKGADPNRNPPPGTVTISLGYQRPGGEGARLAVNDRPLGAVPEPLQAGKLYRLSVLILDDELQVALDGQKYPAQPVRVPADGFYLRLMGWQPNNTWRIRNFCVRQYQGELR